MMKVIVVFKRLLASGNDHIQMGVTAGIFLASILLHGKKRRARCST
jgi:hypothetical protein